MLRALASILMTGTAVISAPAQAAGIHSFHADHVLGTSLDVTLAAVAAPLARAAMDAIHAEIARLEAVLSGWRGDSELAALNRASVFKASPDLFRLIQAGEAWRSRTDGAFSIRLGGLAASSASEDLATHIALVDVGLSGEDLQITRPARVRFAVDAIAKGYILDRALDVARSIPGVQGAMIDIGGDIACWGQARNGAAWHIGVSHTCRSADNAAPAEVIAVRSGAIATTSARARGHAIYDPRTGAPVETMAQTTAVAPSAVDADALATAVYVLPPEDGIGLANSIPGAAVRLVASDGTVHTSERWKGLVLAQNVPARPRAGAAATGAAPWPAGFAVNIDYTIPQTSGGRRPRPPYVTIWITNDAGAPVRTLVFYADKPRYMSELYVFWEKIGGANYGLVNSVTRPTRPPGAYSIEWDGKDDAGHTVPQGRYTVNIEAAREHGGHSIQRIDLDLTAAPTSAEAPAQQELGPTHVRYGK
jgi:thiamine biosynthesis lipoprotein